MMISKMMLTIEVIIAELLASVSVMTRSADSAPTAKYSPIVPAALKHYTDTIRYSKVKTTLHWKRCKIWFQPSSLKGINRSKWTYILTQHQHKKYSFLLNYRRYKSFYFTALMSIPLPSAKLYFPHSRESFNPDHQDLAHTHSRTEHFGNSRPPGPCPYTLEPSSITAQQNFRNTPIHSKHNILEF